LVFCSLTEESKKPPEDTEQGNELVHKEMEEKPKKELRYLHSVTLVGHGLLENHWLDMEQLEELEQK